MDLLEQVEQNFMLENLYKMFNLRYEDIIPLPLVWKPVCELLNTKENFQTTQNTLNANRH